MSGGAMRKRGAHCPRHSEFVLLDKEPLTNRCLLGLMEAPSSVGAGYLPKNHQLREVCGGPSTPVGTGQA